MEQKIRMQFLFVPFWGGGGGIEILNLKSTKTFTLNYLLIIMYFILCTLNFAICTMNFAFHTLKYMHFTTNTLQHTSLSTKALQKKHFVIHNQHHPLRNTNFARNTLHHTLCSLHFAKTGCNKHFTVHTL